MTIAVDFDGTIVEHKYPEIGKELPFAFDSLKRLQENGHRIILWTVREGDRLAEAVEYCRRKGLEFYAVNSEYPDASWSGEGVSRKVQADVYIDDRGVGGIPDWTTIYDMITSHLSFNDILDKAIAGETLPESLDFNNGSFNRPHRHHRSKHRRKGLFRWIAERCRASRTKFSK